MRWTTIVLTALLAVCAVPVGAMLVAAPDGHLLGAQPAWLAGLPFQSYLLPGLILGGVVGGAALLACVLAARRSRWAALATALCAVILLVWITVQLATVPVRSPLQPIIVVWGSLLVALGASGTSTFWLGWVAANATAELVGLGVVALGAAGLAGTRFFAPALIVLGGLEGLVVGAAQAQLLRRRWPALRPSRWIRATVLGAVVAWVLGLLPSLLLDEGSAGAAPPAWLQVVLASGLGLVAGPILAAFQVRELRRHVARAGWWLPANAVAWAAAMPVVFQAAGSGRRVAGLALLLAAGAIAGAVHGLVLVALLTAGRPRPAEATVARSLLTTGS